jgi:flagellar L-ring protein precursor FlgH
MRTLSQTVFLVILVVLAAALGACAQSQSARVEDEIRTAYETPPVIRATPAEGEDLFSRDGSLFEPGSRGWNLWSDDTARAVGDIVTVRVSVNHSAKKSATTDLGRTSEIDAGITALLGYEADLPGVGGKNPLSNTKADQLIKAKSSNSFKGEGDTARSDKVVADVSAVVTHVYPNGNMRIHGTQSLLINNENSLCSVDGVVRPSDISYNNVVLSNRIAQCKIEVTGRGVISDKQSPGILSRAVDWFWPF